MSSWGKYASLTQLKRLDGPFDFYTETHPNLNFRGDSILECDLPAEDRVRLHRTEINITRGKVVTDDPAVAYALLCAPDWLGLVPGEWYQQLIKKERKRRGQDSV